MKYLKMLGLAALAAMALTAVAASSASATTLATKGVAENAAITLTSTIKSGTSAILKTTGGGFANTCTESHVKGTTTTFTAENSKPIGGPISELSFSKCTEEPVVVDEKGSLTVEWISGTTNGTVRSSGAKVTSPSPFGALTCVTGAGTHIGTLTGVKEGNATMDIKAVLNCGFFIPSALWEGTYTVTTPTNLGVEK